MLSFLSKTNQAASTGTPAPRSPSEWPAAPPGPAALLEWLNSAPSDGPQVRANAIALTRQGSFPTAAEEVAFMGTEGYRPRADCAAVRIKRPVDWCMDPFKDRNWRSQLNMLRLLDPYLRAYEQTEDARYLRQAFDYALDWAQFHRDGKHKNAFAWVDMVVGIRAQRLAYLAERLRHGSFSATSSERILFARLLADHWKRLTTPGFFKYTNHTIVDIHGLTALLRSTLAGDPGRPAWEAAIGRHLDHSLELQFDEFGVHRENSPGYQFVAKNMFVGLNRSGWYTRISPNLALTVERATAMESWMRMPDGRLVPFGDTDGEPPRAGTPPLSCAPSSAPDVRVSSMNHSGYCFVRAERGTRPEAWSFLGIKAGFEVNTHRHHDELSYLWSEAGWDIVVDAGKYSYDADAMRQYARSARAHNVIEFGGLDSNADVAHRTGHLTRAIQQAPWGVRVHASWVHQPLGVRQRRAFYFCPGRWLVVRDDFAAAAAVPYVHRTHLAPEFRVVLERDRFAAEHEGGRRLAIATWTSQPVERWVRSGDPEPAMEGWISRKYRARQPAPTLGLSGTAAHGTVVMALSLEDGATLEADDAGMPRWSAADVSFPVLPLEE